MVDEEELLGRCRAGDQQGFTELFNRYKVRALRLAYAVTGDPALAEDATQEAFIQAFRAIGNIRPGAPFGPWFYAILTNRARRLAIRRRWRWLPLLSAEALPDVGAAKALDSAENGHVWEATRRLPVELRVVVALRYVLDMSEAEMASVLNLPTGTVKSRLHRARELLKKQLRVDWEEEPRTWTPLMK